MFEVLWFADKYVSTELLVGRHRNSYACAIVSVDLRNQESGVPARVLPPGSLVWFRVPGLDGRSLLE